MTGELNPQRTAGETEVLDIVYPGSLVKIQE